MAYNCVEFEKLLIEFIFSRRDVRINGVFKGVGNRGEINFRNTGRRYEDLFFAQLQANTLNKQLMKKSGEF